MPRLIQNAAQFASKIMKVKHFPRLRRATFIRKRTSGSKWRKNDHQAQTYRFGGHLVWCIFRYFRSLLGDHVGRLGADLSQHRPILSHLGRASGHLEAVSGQLGEPKMLIFFAFFDYFCKIEVSNKKWSSWPVLRPSWRLLG